jgi:hypothetical protein
LHARLYRYKIKSRSSVDIRTARDVARASVVVDAPSSARSLVDSSIAVRARASERTLTTSTGVTAPCVNPQQIPPESAPRR